MESDSHWEKYHAQRFPLFNANKFWENVLESDLHREKYHAQRFPLFKANKFVENRMEKRQVHK